MKRTILPLLLFVSLVALAGTEMMRIHFKDGRVSLVDVATVDSITFVQAVEPATITVSGITLDAVSVAVEPDASVGRYTVGIVRQSDFDGYASDSEFFSAQLNQMKADAGAFGMTIGEYLDFVLYDGAEGRQTFSYDGLTAGTAYYVYAYGMSPTTCEPTTVIAKEAFSTQALLEVDFSLSVSGLSAKKGTVSATPDNNDIYYYLGFTSEDAYQNAFNGDDMTLRDNALAQVVNNMTMGGVFEQLAHKGEAQLSMQGLVPNTVYYAIAFGMEKKGGNSAYATTALSKHRFVTPAFTVTDDCTFAISDINASSLLIDMKVTPSNAATRYYATVKADSETFGKTPAQVADEQIVFEDGFHIDWANSKQIFTGERTLNSRADLGVTNILPETDYTIYVFGVDTEGCRTTEVSTAKARTTAAEASSMTIAFENVTTGSETDSQDFFKTNYFVEFSPVPSVDNEYYYVGLASKDDYEWATVFGSEDDFIKEVITAAGDNIMLNCFLGKPEQPLKGLTDYKGNDLKPDTDYYLVAFGYMGSATTGLFKQLVHTSGSSSGGGW